MEKEMVLVNKDERGVVTVTLNRPGIHNAFNDKLISELTKLFNSLASEDDVRVVVLTGSGRSFCAGADLNWMKGMINYSEEENYNDSVALATLFETINNFQKPVIGKINGSAIGGGAGLVAVCDYCIAVDSAKFGFTEVRLGLVPAVISPYVIAKIGESSARSTFLSGSMFRAGKAYEIGLVHEVVKAEDYEESFDRLINSFLKAGPSGAVTAKLLIKDVLSLKSPEELKEYTCKVIAKARTSDEGQEGMDALLTKRKASWVTEKEL